MPRAKGDGLMAKHGGMTWGETERGKLTVQFNRLVIFLPAFLPLQIKFIAYVFLHSTPAGPLLTHIMFISRVFIYKSM